MQILVLGGDGYLGWPTALHLSAAGHDVAVNDNFARRGYDEEMGVDSLVPIATLDERIAAWTDVSGKTIKAYVGDLCDPEFTHATTRIDQLFDVVERYKDRVDVAAIRPTVRWRAITSKLPDPSATLAKA